MRTFCFARLKMFLMYRNFGQNCDVPKESVLVLLQHFLASSSCFSTFWLSTNATAVTSRWAEIFVGSASLVLWHKSASTTGSILSLVSGWMAYSDACFICSLDSITWWPICSRWALLLLWNSVVETMEHQGCWSYHVCIWNWILGDTWNCILVILVFLNDDDDYDEDECTIAMTLKTLWA